MTAPSPAGAAGAGAEEGAPRAPPPASEPIAAATAAETENDRQPPYVLLQDYHLYLATARVREKVPGATILHFTHIPWPGPRYWGILPEFMRKTIHEDICAADIVEI